MKCTTQNAAEEQTHTPTHTTSTGCQDPGEPVNPGPNASVWLAWLMATRRQRPLWNKGCVGEIKSAFSGSATQKIPVVHLKNWGTFCQIYSHIQGHTLLLGVCEHDSIYRTQSACGEPLRLVFQSPSLWLRRHAALKNVLLWGRI